MDQRVTQLLSDSLSEQRLIFAVFSALRKKSTPYRKVTVKPVLLQNHLFYQAEYHFEKKVTHENLSSEECLALCTELLTSVFKQANLFTAEHDYQILANKPERARITEQPPTKSPGSLSHDRRKEYILADGEPCDFLIRLGVMTPQGRVHAKHYGKFRQINRFLEIVDDVLPALLPQFRACGQNRRAADGVSADDIPTDDAFTGDAFTGGASGGCAGDAVPLKIIDFGCGKAYLTFALYYYLKQKKGLPVQIVGLDLKEDVIAFCSQVASDLHYDGLRFQMGDIADYDETARADMVVTLHACDTATDFALMKAVAWQASVILSVPCCQHELFYQIRNPLHAPLLSHGILKERMAAILTDELRALKLQEHGYDVSMIEFTSLEHTAKNIMLRCTKIPERSSGFAGSSGASDAFAPSDAFALSEASAPSEALVSSGALASADAPAPSVSSVSLSRRRAQRQAAEDYARLCEFWQVQPTIGQMK